MKINGIEFEFDIADVNDADNYGMALKNYDDALKTLKKETDSFVVLKKGLQMVKDFFYDATGIDVLADITNYRKALEMYREFINEVAIQVNELKHMMDEEIPAVKEEKQKINNMPINLSDETKKKILLSTGTKRPDRK